MGRVELQRWRRLRKRLALLSAMLVLIVATIATVPPLRARAKAVAVLADGVGFPFPRPFARTIEVREMDAGGLTGDFYFAREGAPTILFVPGAARRGLEDPRVIEAATALAKANRNVFVPQLDLYNRIFDEADIERIRGAITALSNRADVGIIAFSYGASFALIAMQDTELAEDVSFVAAFGAYYDLTNLVQAITTGATILDNEQVAFATVPEAREILVDSLIRIAPAAYADSLRAALETGDPAGLPDDAATVFRLLSNEEPELVDALVAELPITYHDFLTKFSPAPGIDRLDVPVYIMQAYQDEATPWTEGVLLDRNLEDSRAVFLEHFSHVDPPGTIGILLDAPDAWRFISWILVAQE